METPVLEKAAQTTKKIQLIRGTFTPSEASHVIGALIDEKINFHKIQRLQRWEGNHKCKGGELNGRIQELETSKAETKRFISEFRKQGKTFRIDGFIELTVTEAEND